MATLTARLTRPLARRLTASSVGGFLLGNGAALDLDFTRQSLDPRITFARASTAMRYNPSGVLESVASGLPRFDYDPVTLLPRGLLIEEARTNLFTRSDAFDHADWAKVNQTVTANAAASPDGTTNAEEAALTSNGGTIGQTIAMTAATYAFTFYAKAAASSWVRVRVVATDTVQLYVNLTTGATGVLNGTGAVITAATAITPVSVGNGWWRIGILLTFVGTPSTLFSIVPTSADNTNGVTGNSNYLYGAQLELGAFATSYIPTTSAAATRAGDAVSITDVTAFHNPLAGTLHIEFVQGPSTAFGSLVSTRVDGNNHVRISRSSTKIAIDIVTAAAQQAGSASTNTPVDGTTYKAALAYAANDAAMAMTTSLHATVITDASITLPTGTFALWIGSSSGASYVNGWIKSIKYYRTRLPNATLQGLTA